MGIPMCNHHVPFVVIACKNENRKSWFDLCDAHLYYFNVFESVVITYDNLNVFFLYLGICFIQAGLRESSENTALKQVQLKTLVQSLLTSGFMLIMSTSDCIIMARQRIFIRWTITTVL